MIENTSFLVNRKDEQNKDENKKKILCSDAAGRWRNADSKTRNAVNMTKIGRK